MNRDEYFWVFEAIIFGLALAELLSGINKMIIHRRTIKVYWAHLLFVFVYVLILITQYSWEFYRTPFALVDSVFTFIVFVVIFPVSYFFGAHQAFPPNFENVDFKVFFYSNKKVILIPVFVMQLAIVNKSVFEIIAAKGIESFPRYAFSLSGWYLWQQAFFALFILFAARSKTRWPSEVLAVLAFIVQILITFIKFEPL